MMFFLTNRIRAHLTPAQQGELGELAKVFYTKVPAGVSVRGEWTAADQSRNYTLLDAPDVETVQRMQAPFAPYVESEIVAVVPVAGWREVDLDRTW